MSETPALDAPILLIAFNRPAYLDRLCAALRAQSGVRLDPARVHLVQDGAVSPRSGERYAEDAALAESLAVFRRHFPEGHAHPSAENLGIAMNMRRAERLAFETLGAEIAYVFEEDLEPGPLYLWALEQIRARAGTSPRLGYFAAYGDPRAEADPARPRIIPLEHHWGFGLTRRCWQALQPWIAPFEEVWRRVDYQARPHLRLLECYAEKIVAGAASSQDSVKAMGCAELGFARINTDACFARYIGESGQSFSPERFREGGHDRTEVVETRPEVFPDIPDALLARLAAERRLEATRFRAARWPGLIEEMRGRLLDPDRVATEEEATLLWKLLLDRAPPPEFWQSPQGSVTVRELRARLMTSREGRAKSFLLKRLRGQGVVG